MPWLLMSPGHQQPWCSLCRIGRSLSHMGNDFNYRCHVNMEQWCKCKYMFMCPLKNLAHKGSSCDECSKAYDGHHDIFSTICYVAMPQKSIKGEYTLWRCGNSGPCQFSSIKVTILLPTSLCQNHWYFMNLVWWQKFIAPHKSCVIEGGWSLHPS